MSLHPSDPPPHPVLRCCGGGCRDCRVLFFSISNPLPLLKKRAGVDKGDRVDVASRWVRARAERDSAHQRSDRARQSLHIFQRYISLPLSLIHTHTLSLYLSLFRSLSQARALFLSLSRSHSLSLACSLALSLSLSLFLSFSLSLFLSLSLPLSVCLCVCVCVCMFIYVYVYTYTRIRGMDRLLSIDGNSVRHASFEAVTQAFGGPGTMCVCV